MSDHLLVYDADCGFCRWSVARVLAWDADRRVRPVAMQSEEGRRLLGGLDPEVAAASWHLLVPAGRLLSGGAVVAPLASLLRGGAPIAALARRFPRATDRAYRFGAGHRDVLGRVTRRLGSADAARRRIAERA